MQTLLLDLLRSPPAGKLDRPRFARAVEAAMAALSPDEGAQLFLSSAFLLSASHALRDLHWLQTHDLEAQQPAFEAFMAVVLGRELAPLAFLEPLLQNPARADLQGLAAMAEVIVTATTAHARALTDADRRNFAATVMLGMDGLVRLENSWHPERREAELALARRLRALGPAAEWPATRASALEGFAPHSLYRTFDALDEILGLDYAQDSTLTVDTGGKERLYVGGGLGVQTSYATLLIALEALKLAPRARLIDLGCGYGRLGFVTGFLRPDLEFIGYEYVTQRVASARSAANRLGLDSHVSFIAQDLADASFQIPEAEVYYLYDPFSAETYRHVMRQLKAIGRRRTITVATKGHAHDWLVDAIQGEGWSGPERHDAGTLSLFRSAA